MSVKITSDKDIFYLRRSLGLAKKGCGLAHPNPMVGAIIVKSKKIISEGYFHGIGQPHAEVEALQRAKLSVVGATMYVNLEPHCFQGRTPPCTQAIIKSGIKRVVCATLDPNPKVRGRGIQQLRAAGVLVTVSKVVATEAVALNESYFTFHNKKRPFVAIKFASSLDGKIATKTGDSQWITNLEARIFACSLRTTCQAILIGSNTVVKDNPHLGARSPNKPDPLRIILDNSLKSPLKAQVFRDNNVFVATTSAANKQKKKELERRGIAVLTFPGKQIPIPQLLVELKRRGIISIFVEGGSEVLGYGYRYTSMPNGCSPHFHCGNPKAKSR